MKGSEVVEALERKLKVRGDRELALKLGRSAQSVRGWRAAESLTAKQIANMLADGKAVAKEEAAHEAITTIVEFFTIEHVLSKQEKHLEPFPTRGDPYLQGLRGRLEASRGIYVFYDSRGRALYAGKAEKQSLWKEMKLAFNRERPQQVLWRVDHGAPSAFDAEREGRHRIAPQAVQLWDLAAYFSAYEVPAPMIPQLEALLIRAFANDLLNLRIEKFKHQKDG